MVCLRTSDPDTVTKYEDLLTSDIPSQKLSIELSLTKTQKRAIIEGLLSNNFELPTKP